MDGGEPSRMTSSEHRSIMVCPNTYSASPQDNSMLMPNSAGMTQGIHLPFNSMAPWTSRSMESSNSLYHGDALLGMRPGAGLDVNEPAKKKRGRPRKYGPDGITMLALTSPMSVASAYSSSPLSEPPLSMRRVHPPGSGKKQQHDALGSSRFGFTPHIIAAKPGEDVASKILAFSEQGPCTVCIISANGAICNATLRQPATSGGTMSYEGHFEIVSLSGLFMPMENGGTQSRSCSLSVALAEQGGRVLGGVVAGMLTAATPVQVVAASFMAEGKRPMLDPLKCEPSSSPQSGGFGVTSTSSPSHGASSESTDDKLGSQVNQHPEMCNNSGQPVPNISAYTSVS